MTRKGITLADLSWLATFRVVGGLRERAQN